MHLALVLLVLRLRVPFHDEHVVRTVHLPRPPRP